MINSTRANLAIRKIKPQFGDTPEEQLMFGVVRKAIQDMAFNRHRTMAVLYLKGGMVHATACGVDPDWIRSVLKRCGFDMNAIAVAIHEETEDA